MMAAESEHAGSLFQGVRRAGEAVGGGAPALSRVGHPQPVEAAVGEPVADPRQQVRGPAAASPDHRAAPGAQLTAVAHRALDVCVSVDGLLIAEEVVPADELRGLARPQLAHDA
jgi:hypothetical protein